MKHGSNDDIIDIVERLRALGFVYALIVGKEGESVTRVWSNGDDYAPDGDDDYDALDVMEAAFDKYIKLRRAEDEGNN